MNLDHPNAYEHLSLIVSSYEEAAMRSGKRAGILAASHTPLSGMELLLRSSDRLLEDTQHRGQRASSGRLSAEADVNLQDPEVRSSVSLETEGHSGTIVDIDLLEALDALGPGDMGSRYIAECLGCSGRVNIEWQIRPINLLGSINGLLNSIERSLDSFIERLDPIRHLSGICELLNAVRGFCLQDLVIMLASIKFLTRRYLENSLSVRIDWTTILGPLISAVVQGVNDFLNNIMGIISSGLGCTRASLASAQTALNQARDTIRSLDAALTSPNGIRSDLSILEIEADWEKGLKLTKQVKADPTEEDQQLENLKSVAEYKAKTEDRKKQTIRDSKASVPVGFNYFADLELKDAIESDAFKNVTAIEKMLLTLSNAQQEIRELFKKVTKALNSITRLTSGGMGVDLSNMGVLLFLADMTSLVMLLIRMISQRGRGVDWCRVLSENPGLLEEQLQRTNPGITVESLENDRLLLRKGQDIVGEIPTCSIHRTKANNDLLAQWVAELESRR